MDFAELQQRFDVPEDTRLFVFDVGKVLVNINVMKSAQEIAKACSAAVTAEFVKYHLFYSDLNQQVMIGKITSQEFYQAMTKKLMMRLDYEQFKLFFQDIFTDLNEEVVELICHLMINSRTLAILSNATKLQYEYLESRLSWLARLRENTFLSYELHVLKPDPHIYVEVEKRFGIDPKHIFFLDDNQGNVIQAKKRGWQARLYQPQV